MEAARARSFAPPPGTTRYSTLVPSETLERMRNLVWWERSTLSAFVRSALADAIERHHAQERHLVNPSTGEVITKAKGDPYPARHTELKPGRPMT